MGFLSAGFSCHFIENHVEGYELKFLGNQSGDSGMKNPWICTIVWVVKSILSFFLSFKKGQG